VVCQIQSGTGIPFLCALFFLIILHFFELAPTTRLGAACVANDTTRLVTVLVSLSLFLFFCREADSKKSTHWFIDSQMAAAAANAAVVPKNVPGAHSYLQVFAIEYTEPLTTYKVAQLCKELELLYLMGLRRGGGRTRRSVGNSAGVIARAKSDWFRRNGWQPCLATVWRPFPLRAEKRFGPPSERGFWTV
jgi:hypothetical protein